MYHFRYPDVAKLRKRPLPRIGQVIQSTGLTVLFLSALLLNTRLHAFRVFDLTDEGFGIGRWDAAPLVVDGVERSLDGGIRYSVTGGSWEAFHDALPWAGTPPTVDDLQNAVEEAFATWEAVDPVTGLGTDVRFVPDFDTAVVSGWNLSRDVLNPGAEIDLIAISHSSRLRWSIHGFQDANLNRVTLTSGVQDYPAAVAAGGDIEFSTNRSWTLDQLRSDLAYTIPFLIAITNADEPHGDRRSRFYDDNYDDSSSATALATLTNSFAHLIDPFDPDNSPGLMLYDVCEVIGNDCVGDPGISTPGVNLLTEYTPEAPAPGLQMQNDDFAARQFLYPFVPAPVELAGDYNGNGQVEQGDLDLVLLNWGSDTIPSEWTVNMPSGIIDQQELDGVLLNWGNATASFAAAVPEPSTCLLAAWMCVTAAVVGLQQASRRSRRAVL